MPICPFSLTGIFKVPRESSSARRRSHIIIHTKKLTDQLPVNEKSPEEELLIRIAIEQNEFIRKIIIKKRLDAVVAAMYSREVTPNEIIIKEGEKGNHIYISRQGKFLVMQQRKVVSSFADVRLFGELAILYSAKRLATIKAVTSGCLWVLDSNVYQMILDQEISDDYKEKANFLTKNEILRNMDDNGLKKVVNLLIPEFFQGGHDIVKQGEKGDKFFIINAGSVTVTKTGEGIVNVLNEGDCFGELALTMTDNTRQATVTTNPPGVECLTLTMKEFTDLVEYINLKPKVSIKPIHEYADIQIFDLHRRTTLGKGGFGRVELVEHKEKKLAFALKMLKKNDIVESMQQQHTLNERKIQLACSSPFILKLYRTFRDDKYVFFLMEPCIGGDLWHLLYKLRNHRFEDKDAKFYVACVLEAIDFLHSKEIVYRDLKPENLLIAGNGYLKLSDFGLAKQLRKGDKTFTFAGTPEYLAPEVVLREGYTKAVDYWQIGVIIFELLCKRTPFHCFSGNPMDVYKKISEGLDDVRFPVFVELQAQSLIEKLCRLEPSERLGMRGNGIEDIRNHKWFDKFNWSKLQQFKLKPPFVPKLKGPFDTRYIKEIQEDFLKPPAETSGWDDVFEMLPQELL